MTFRKECAALVAGLIAPLVVEAAGPLAPPALGVIAWVSDKLCGKVIKQFVLTVVPDARQTYNSARKQFCNTAKCVVFTNTLSDPSNCGYCGNACGSSSVCINGACSSQYCSGYHSDLIRCGRGDNHDTCTCANTFYGTGLCAEYTTSCIGNILDHCDSSDDCDPGFVCGLMPGCETQTCLNVAPCAGPNRPASQIETLPPEVQSDWWTFGLVGEGARRYVENPGTLYSLDPKNLVGDASTGIEVNTECIKVSDTVPNVIGLYLYKGDNFYFGWDPDGESSEQKDSCCLLIYGNDHCAAEAEATDYETYCRSVVNEQLPFDVVSWQVTSCASMFKTA